MVKQDFKSLKALAYNCIRRSFIENLKVSHYVSTNGRTIKTRNDWQSYLKGFNPEITPEDTYRIIKGAGKKFREYVRNTANYAWDYMNYEWRFLITLQDYADYFYYRGHTRDGHISASDEEWQLSTKRFPKIGKMVDIQKVPLVDVSPLKR